MREQAFARCDEALDETREPVAPAVADEHEEIGAVLHFGERRRDPARLLENVEVAVLRCRAGVVDDRTATACERERRAHPGDVGAESADERPPCAGEQSRCGIQRRLHARALTLHPRRGRRRRGSAEGCERRTALLACAVARRERCAVDSTARSSHSRPQNGQVARRVTDKGRERDSTGEPQAYSTPPRRWRARDPRSDANTTVLLS